jgi:hypothetical protein
MSFTTTNEPGYDDPQTYAGDTPERTIKLTIKTTADLELVIAALGEALEFFNEDIGSNPAHLGQTIVMGETPTHANAFETITGPFKDDEDAETAE